MWRLKNFRPPNSTQVLAPQLRIQIPSEQLQTQKLFIKPSYPNSKVEAMDLEYRPLILIYRIYLLCGLYVPSVSVQCL